MAYRLAVVIHAEEEFDWSKGVKTTNQSVTHHNELILLIDELLAAGAKVTLAMDYPFISSPEGASVVERFRGLADSNIEFAAHLHPWVNPPFEDLALGDSVAAVNTYPGNLPKELEYKKLVRLTEKIESVSGVRPVTYLAGRYGIGNNTARSLVRLGYKIDLSISAYCDFTSQGGPDFSHYGNTIFERDEIIYFPHTCSILSTVSVLQDYANKHTSFFTQCQNNMIKKVISKCLRLRRYRLSPEGFSLKEMQQLTHSQKKIGQRDFILSLHSPSVKAAMTSYAKNHIESKQLALNTRDFVCWFIGEQGGQAMLPKQLVY